MSRMPADESVDNTEERFSFEKFARHHFFKQANAWLVAHSGICSNSSVVDLACGPGAVTELILRELDETVPGTCVYAVDPSPSALALARKRAHSPIVRFIQGSAERLASLVPQVDVVVFTNAIHLVADKVTAFEQVFKTLRRGGVLGFNTTFFDGAYPGEPRRFRRAARRVAGEGIKPGELGGYRTVLVVYRRRATRSAPGCRRRGVDVRGPTGVRRVEAVPCPPQLVAGRGPPRVTLESRIALGTA